MSTLEDPMNSNRSPQRPHNEAAGKVFTKRVRANDRTTLTLSYTPADAARLRTMAQSMSLKGGKSPAMSVIARRSLDVYAQVLESNTAAEVDAVARMTTAHPADRKGQRS
jgi:hypothetical protein